LVLIDHSQHVCSFYDANEAQEIEEISLLFFVYNLSATPIQWSPALSAI
jgi:hypothetical protein